MVALASRARRDGGRRSGLRFRSPSPSTTYDRPRLPASLHGVRTLAVDDNDTNLQVLREYLSRWGLDVTTVASATDALDRISDAAEEGSPYRIILLDRLMPDIDGLRLARMIRSHGELGDPKLIMLTSLDENVPGDELHELELTCLQKPLRQSRLFDAVITAVESGENADASRPATESTDSLPTRPEKRRVLIVDDNEVNRMVAGEILRSVGYETRDAKNGRQGD